MKSCSTCQAPLPADAAFCPRCGAGTPAPEPDATLPVAPDMAMTTPVPPAPATSPSLNMSGTESAAGVRFIPGEIVKERYRIVGLLGRGGMGEVYRAEDLKLGQQVALKFLPPGLEQDPRRLELFLNEVRTARQVTHPNVCRVYDIDETDGHHFLSMEYVDGEDLATSLTRIGRLPEERAVPVARQICAGLAAAHDQGILHRDLKPANVMIDGRGRVKLTDFGLAGLAAGFGDADVTVGTPAYMSPEQITGREVSIRSDIYALGLVLYELFTGQPPFRAETMADYRQLHTDSMPSHPTMHVPGLDPVVEQAIMRCLVKDPVQRPVSALSVAAALPGGDPLQAALAAGETPSPELVAEAGRRRGMAPGRAVLLATVAVVLLGGACHWAARLSTVNFLPLDKRPEVLVDRARDVIATAGYTAEVYENPVDEAWGLITWNDVVREVGAADSSRTRWDALRDRPDAAGLWYRQAPRVLMPVPSPGPLLIRGDVTLTNPHPTSAGEVIVVLDLAGRLRRLEVMPRRFAQEDPSEPDWYTLFALAGLDTARFRSTPPRYQRFMAPDLRRAWIGTRAEQPDVTLRVEAGASEGRSVLFNIATEEALAGLSAPPQNRTWGMNNWLLGFLQPLIILAIVVASFRAGRRNSAAGRIDSRGAGRFAGLVFCLFLIGETLASHTFFTRLWAEEIWPILAGAVFTGAIAWALYGAAEPLGRRIWPQMFVSSSRLFSQPTVPRRDPLIGQSVLVGMIAGGVAFLMTGPVRWAILTPLLGDPPRLGLVDLDLVASQRQALALVLNQALVIGYLFIHIMALVLIRFLVKRRWPAIGLTLAVWVLLSGPGSLEAAAYALVTAAISLFVLLRWGAVALVITRVVQSLAWSARPLDLDGWVSQGSVVVMIALFLMGVYGAWAAVGDFEARHRPSGDSATLT